MGLGGGGGGAESHLHGLGEGEAELSSSFRSGRSLASASDASFRSSVGSSADLEFDDDDGDFLSPRPQSEYEEIPSFRWIASPLRWWKTRKRTHLSKRSAAAAATASGPREEPSSEDYYTEVYYAGGDRRIELMHYDVPPAPFTIADLLNAEAEVLGQAAHGTSYKVMLEDGKGVLAVKRLRWEGITSEFGAKIKLLGKIRHPNILPPKAYFSSEDIHLLVLDHMPVGSLSSVLHADGPRTPLDWPTRMNIAIEAARGLRYLHMEAKLLHGNLTSVNVLLDEQANAKIADCGLSLLVTPASSTEDLAYRAPEISKVENMNNADTKTDVYSLGVIFLELLTGKSPWEATDGLDVPQWVASAVKEHSADKVFDPILMGMGRVSGTMRNEMLDTLTLALSCVDASPDERPKVQRVLQQLEDIRSGRAGAGAAAAKAQGDNKPAVEGPGAEGATGAATSIIGVGYLPSSTLDRTIEERWALPVEGAGAGTSVSSQNDLEEDDHTPTPTPVEEINQDNSGDDEQELPTPCEGDVEAPPHSQDQSADTHIKATATEFTAPMSHRPNGDSSIISSTAQPEDGTGETSSSEGIDATSDGTAVSPLSSIDWAKVAIDVRLEAPSSPPLISSDPDLIYQRYLQMLYDLAHRSPPLPSDVLEVQLNKMVIGLQSLGYPLETWLKAATLVLVTAKKREHIEQHVDDCKLNVETQLKVLASVIDPVKEELSRAQSDIATLELEEEEIGETISKLHDQLALLEDRRGEVGGLLTTARDQIAEAEAKVEPLLVAMSRLNQQHSSILDLQRGMLLELPSLDEAFDGSFREILTKKF